MALIQFPYRRVEGTLQPTIAIGVKLEDNWQRIDAYVDSGAAYSVIKTEIADCVGFDYKTGNPIELQVGDGRWIPVYLSYLEVQLGTTRFFCPIGFSEQLGVRFNVLGRKGVFERFRVCFQEAQGVLSFEANE
jgi:hypothetical protein